MTVPGGWENQPFLACFGMIFVKTLIYVNYLVKD